MSINILEECSYLLNDGRYVQVQAKNSKHVYAFYFIVKEVNDNSIIIEDFVLNRVPELILDCRILHVIEHTDIIRQIYVVQSIHFTNLLMHYRIGQKFLFRISKIIPKESNDADSVDDNGNQMYLDIINMKYYFAPNTYYVDYLACPSTKKLRSNWYNAFFNNICNPSAVGLNLNQQYSSYLFIESVHNGIQHALRTTVGKSIHFIFHCDLKTVFF